MRRYAKKMKASLLALGLFRLCLAASFLAHSIGYAAFYISTLPSREELNSSELKVENIDVDFQDIPPELLGGSGGNPAPVEKKEWVEGTGKGKDDAPPDDADTGAISGDGTDKDGYLFSWKGDRPPTPIIDFDLRHYFPREARLANITNKTVVVSIQVDTDGSLKRARVVSARSGFGFEEAALKVVRRARFAPGYVKGRPTKMTHDLPIRFVLE